MPRSVLDEEALARAGGRSGVGAGVGVGFAFAVLEEIVASEPPLMLVGPLESQVIDFAQCVALFALNVPDETVVALACDKNLALETINVLDGVLKDTLKRGSLRGGLLKTRPAAAHREKQTKQNFIVFIVTAATRAEFQRISQVSAFSLRKHVNNSWRL